MELQLQQVQVQVQSVQVEGHSHSAYELGNTCRCCLTQQATFTPLYHNTNLSQFDNTTIADMFLHTFNLQINEDNFPWQVCEDCLQAINMSYNFKKQVMRCSEILQYQLKGNIPDNEPGTIEYEILIIPPNDPTATDDFENAQPYDDFEENTTIDENATDDGNKTTIEDTENVIADNENYTQTNDENEIPKSQFTCEKCGVQLKSKSGYRMHLISHNKKSTCEICGHVFKYRYMLEKHMNIHTRKGPMACALCNQPVKDDIRLNKHMKIAHTGESHKCEICGKEFAHPSRLKKHLVSHNSQQDRRLVCKFCPKKFNFFHHLKNHERTHTGIKPFLCSICGKDFSQKYNLTLHLKQHDIVQPYPCKHCNKTFAQQQRLQRHMVTHLEKKYKCNDCEKIYSSKQELANHLKTSHESSLLQPSSKENMPSNGTTGKRINSEEPLDLKTYHCNMCNEKFSTLTAVMNHKKKMNCRKYTCDICRKCFNLKTILTRHMLTQHKSEEKRERKYPCEECGLKYFKKNHLLAHISRMHLKDRPFKCSFCPKTFCLVGELNVHTRRHKGEKPYVCSYCDKGFPVSSALKVHIRTHTGEKPNKCTICAKSFSVTSALLTHMKIHVKTELPIEVSSENPTPAPTLTEPIEISENIVKIKPQETSPSRIVRKIKLKDIQKLLARSLSLKAAEKKSENS